MSGPQTAEMLEREQIANRPKHWVRMVTACNSRCLFCLDADTPRNVMLPNDEIRAELDRGLHELGADKVILSGGEAALHPDFMELVGYAKSIGYDRVQTVTNGWRYAERDFYQQAVDAGLGEITFSLHGHTEALHDELTQHRGSFKRISKAILRAVRDPRVIANVDVVINGMNVGVIDRIVEYAMKLGIREFDLLHVIPQANAFDNRERMFYDVREHIPRLHKVFRLNRHPGVVIWTNRFPVPWLEGLEDLIQDPHKMLDEVNGRRFMVRNYLDTGKKLECRDAERCTHCFIEPFCNTMDEVIASQNAREWAIWWVGEHHDDPRPVPQGITHLGVTVPTASQLDSVRRPGLGLFAEVTDASVPASTSDLILRVRTPAQLDAWLDTDAPLVIELDRPLARWMLDHRERIAAHADRLHVHQPGHEKLAQAVANDVRDPADFFEQLGLRLQVSGLPACAAPGTQLVDEPKVLPAHLFDADTGRVSIRELARYHISDRYRAKSVRCADCRLTTRCEGHHVNLIRDQGLKLCRPVQGAWADDAEAQLTARWPTPPERVGTGRSLQPPAPSLPGFAMPTAEVDDPLAVLALEFKAKREARRRAREQAALARAEEG